jgi:integrase
MNIRAKVYRRTGRRVWVASYKDQHGKRRQPEFTTKKMAEAHMKSAVTAIDKGTFVVDRESITIRHAGDAYLAMLRSEEFAPATIEGHQGRLAKHIYPQIGDLRLSHWAAPQVQLFLDNLGVSSDLTRRIRNTLSAVLDEAVRVGATPINVVRSLKPRRQPRRRMQEKKPVRIPERIEARAMIENAPPKLHPMLLLVMFCGLRWGEVRALHPRDIKDGFITVRRSADKFGNVTDFVKTDAGRRRVPMPPPVAEALRGWRPTVKSQLLFPSEEGGVLFLPNIQKRWLAPLQRRLGITDGTTVVTRRRIDGKTRVDVPRAKYTPNAFRHFAVSVWGAVQLRERDHIDWQQIAEWIGHEDPSFTMKRYAHLFEEIREDNAGLIHSAHAWVMDESPSLPA